MSEEVKLAPRCSQGGKVYGNITHSERLNGSFTCSECLTYFPLPEDFRKEVTVPQHRIPEDLHEFRKSMERTDKRQPE